MLLLTKHEINLSQDFFLFRNVQASDLGNYTVKAINNNILSKYYVLVKETTGNEALSPAQIIILVLGIIIFIIMITGLAYCFRFYISFFTKKWFGTYEEGISNVLIRLMKKCLFYFLCIVFTSISCSSLNNNSCKRVIWLLKNRNARNKSN